MSGKGQYNVIVEMDDEPTIQVRSNKMCWMLAGMLIMLVEKKHRPTALITTYYNSKVRDVMITKM
jgi:hypothetical protein